MALIGSDQRAYGVVLFERIRHVALLEEVCHWKWALRFSKAQARANGFLFLLPSDRELSATSPAPCLPVCCHASHHDDNEITLQNCTLHFNAFPYELPWPQGLESRIQERGCGLSSVTKESCGVCLTRAIHSNRTLRQTQQGTRHCCNRPDYASCLQNVDFGTQDEESS